jgi:hypothetical protein
MPNLGGALDGGNRGVVDAERAPQELKNPPLFHPHFEIGGGNLEGRRIGRVVQVGRYRRARERQNRVQPILLGEQPLACLSGGDKAVLVEILEDRPGADDGSDPPKLDIGHLAVGRRGNNHQIDQRFMRARFAHLVPLVRRGRSHASLL